MRTRLRRSVRTHGRAMRLSWRASPSHSRPVRGGAHRPTGGAGGASQWGSSGEAAVQRRSAIVVTRGRQVAAATQHKGPGPRWTRPRPFRTAVLLLLGNRRDERLLGPGLRGEVDQPGAVRGAVAVA